MLLMSNSKQEIEEVISELASLELNFNLRLNKKKSEILTAEDVEDIAGIKCRKEVKYLGVRGNTDKKEQKRIAKEQIQRNLNSLRWRLKGGEPNVVQQLTCCLARSLLIYIGTPMMVAGLGNGRKLTAWRQASTARSSSWAAASPTRPSSTR